MSDVIALFARRRLLLILALWLLWGLALVRFDQSLWLDEGMSVWFARLPLSQLLFDLCDPHPPGYYLLLKGWLLFGAGEAWLRMPSLFAAVLAVAMSVRLGGVIFNDKIGWLAGLLLALHPLQSWYATEVRMYALVQLLGLLLLWIGWQLSIQARWRWYWGLAYVVAALLALWVDVTALFYVGLLQLLWLARGQAAPVRWWALQIGALLPYLLWGLSTGQLGRVQDGYHAVFVAVTMQKLGISLGPAGADHLLQGAFFLLAVAGVGVAWQWRGRLERYATHPITIGLLLLLWLGLLFFSVAPRFFSIKRLLVVALPVLALVTAYALARWPRWFAGALVALGLMASLLTLPTHQREPWRMVVVQLQQDFAPGVDVLWVDDLAVPVFQTYWLQPGQRWDASCGGESNCSSQFADNTAWSPLYARALPELPEQLPEGEGRLWMLMAENPYRHLVKLLPRSFYDSYQAQVVHQEAGIGLYQFNRRTTPLAEDEWSAPTEMDWWGVQMPSPLACGQ